MNNRIILASSSPRRKELLNSIGLRFDIIHPAVMEDKYRSPISPCEYSLGISRKKGLSVCGNTDKEAIVISADTVVVSDSRVFGKPANEQEAFDMLSRLSSRTHEVITAFCLIKGDKTELHSECVKTLVTFKPLASWEIEGYIKTKEPMDKAGSYAIQGIGSFMIDSINGSYTNVVGLPLSNLVDVLKQLGLTDLFDY